MTADEFFQWLDGHKAYWPELAGWLKRIDGPEDGSSHRTLDAWRRTLSNLSLADAEEATRRLYESGDHPRGFGQHAAAVLKMAKAHGGQAEAGEWQQEYVDGQPVYRCGLCLDRGVRSVFEWNLDRLEDLAAKFAAYAEDPEEARLRALSLGSEWVVCTAYGCRAAGAKLGRVTRDTQAKFDGERMLPHSLERSAGVAALARLRQLQASEADEFSTASTGW